MLKNRIHTGFRWTMQGLLALCFALAFPQPLRASGTPNAIDQNGVSYQHYTKAEMPWSIHVIRIDRSRTNLELTTTLGRGSSIGLNRLTEQLHRIPPGLGKPVAAINGDFYTLDGETYAGDPRGLQILGGELISAPIPRDCLWISAAGIPEIGEVTPDFTVSWPNGDKTSFGLNEERSGNNGVLYTSALGTSTRTRNGTELVLERVSLKRWLPLRAGETFPARIRSIEHGGDATITPDTVVLSFSNWSQPSAVAAAAVGDILLLSTATQPSLKGVATAVGGGPILVHQSKAQEARANKSRDRHPRSAIGWNKNYFFLVEVDGRQPGLSIGMTLPELASFMVKIECEEAMNLDGGGSAEIWMNGRIMNRPCFGRERNTANAIAVIDKTSQKP